MKAASRHTRLILAAESLARDTFDSLTLTGDGPCEKTVRLQQEFKTFARLAVQKFESLKAELVIWRDQVSRGDIEFTSEQEDNFKAALHATTSFLSFLIEKFDNHHRDGLFLMNSKRIGLMESHRKEAQEILNSWKSPEWETLNERTVEWNKEQTEHLRARLSSCN